jgi:hypothetical protein
LAVFRDQLGRTIDSHSAPLRIKGSLWLQIRFSVARGRLLHVFSQRGSICDLSSRRFSGRI